MPPSCSFSLRIPLVLYEKFEKSVKEGKFPSVSEAIRSYTKVGMHVESYEPKLEDPKFLKSIEDLKQEEGILQWAETLTESQLDAVVMAMKMERERRYENRAMYRKML